VVKNIDRLFISVEIGYGFEMMIQEIRVSAGANAAR
jgi:hypothetical protein